VEPPMEKRMTGTLGPRPTGDRMEAFTRWAAPGTHCDGRLASKIWASANPVSPLSAPEVRGVHLLPLLSRWPATCSGARVERKAMGNTNRRQIEKLQKLGVG